MQKIAYLGQTFHIHPLGHIFTQQQATFMAGRVHQIINVLIVNLKERHFDQMLDTASIYGNSILAVETLEQIFKAAGQQTTTAIFSYVHFTSRSTTAIFSQNGVRFTRTSLSVGKYRSIVLYKCITLIDQITATCITY